MNKISALDIFLEKDKGNWDRVTELSCLRAAQDLKIELSDMLLFIAPSQHLGYELQKKHIPFVKGYLLSKIGSGENYVFFIKGSDRNLIPNYELPFSPTSLPDSFYDKVIDYSMPSNTIEGMGIANRARLKSDKIN